MNKNDIDRIEEKYDPDAVYDPKSAKFFRKNSLDGLVKKVVDRHEEEFIEVK